MNQRVGRSQQGAAGTQKQTEPSNTLIETCAVEMDEHSHERAALTTYSPDRTNLQDVTWNEEGTRDPIFKGRTKPDTQQGDCYYYCVEGSWGDQCETAGVEEQSKTKQNVDTNPEKDINYI